MRHVVQMSGGLSSAEVAVRVANAHGVGGLTLLFCDTLVEDADLYRFLIESSAYVFGAAGVSDLAERAAGLPPVRENQLADRVALLASLRRDAMLRVPGLVWLCEGRTPWEVISDSRFLSNRSDKCSEYLKRRLSDKWCAENRDVTSTVRYLGFGFNEQHRIERSRARFKADGWRVEFPMDAAPLMNRSDLMRAWMDRGIQPPRLYYQGYPHNNCSGFCFKMGQASAARLLRNDPGYYAFNEAEEARFRSSVRVDASILKDRRGGGPRRPISLAQFREGVACGVEYDAADRGSCSCFADEDDGIFAAPAAETGAADARGNGGTR